MYWALSIYNQHQATANLGWHRGNVGVSFHTKFIISAISQVLRTFEHIRNTNISLRPELGVLWTIQLNVG